MSTTRTRLLVVAEFTLDVALGAAQAFTELARWLVSVAIVVRGERWVIPPPSMMLSESIQHSHSLTQTRRERERHEPHGVVRTESRRDPDEAMNNKHGGREEKYYYSNN